MSEDDDKKESPFRYRPPEYVARHQRHDDVAFEITEQCARDVWDCISDWRHMGIAPMACAFPARQWRDVAFKMSRVWYDIRGLSSWNSSVGENIASSPYRSGP